MQLYLGVIGKRPLLRPFYRLNKLIFEEVARQQAEIVELWYKKLITWNWSNIQWGSRDDKVLYGSVLIAMELEIDYLISSALEVCLYNSRTYAGAACKLYLLGGCRRTEVVDNINRTLNDLYLAQDFPSQQAYIQKLLFIKEAIGNDKLWYYK